MKDNDGVITISREEYDRLLKDSRFLDKLYAAGVDNWEGFSIACEETEEDEE